MPWPTDDLEYDAPDTVPSNPAREGFSAGARKPWRQGIYNLVGKVKAILAQHGVPGGMATLDSTGKLPLGELTVHNHGSSQSPHTHPQYLLASEKGTAGGVASLNSQGDVPADQIGSVNRILLAFNATTGPLLPLHLNSVSNLEVGTICRAPDNVFVLVLLGYQWGNNWNVRSSALYFTGNAMEFFQLPTGSGGSQSSLQIGLIRTPDGYLKGRQQYPNDNARVRVAAVVQLS